MPVTTCQPENRRLAGIARCAGLALLAATLTACIQTQPHRAAQPDTHPQPRVLLMPPDIVVLEIATTGLPLPQAQWTSTAERELVATAEATIAEHGGRLVRYRPADGVVPYAPAHRPAVDLHNAVLGTILDHRYSAGPSAPKLSTKGKHLDWSLGETVAPLRDDYDADYALFLVYRQANATGGRALLAAASFVLFGAIAPTSQAIGLASLVDLHSGEVVWTNVLQGQAWDMSRPDGLDDKGRKLLAELPL